MENVVINGDCEKVLSQFEDGYFDAIVTDPPYCYLPHELDKKFDHEKVAGLFDAKMKDGFVTHFGRGASFYKLNYLLEEKGIKFVEEIIWDKVCPSSGQNAVVRKHETIAILRKGKTKLNKTYVESYPQYQLSDDLHILFGKLQRLCTTLPKINTLEELEDFKQGTYNMKDQVHKHKLTNRLKKQCDRGFTAYQSILRGAKFPSIYRCLTDDHYGYEHPTQKPVELLKSLILLTTPENGIVLDPFAGSCTTAIACLETSRRYVCIEALDKYYEVGMSRIARWHSQHKQLSLF